MPKIIIPTTWESFGLIQLDYTPGESIEAIIDRALRAPLPLGDYVEDSFRPDYDGIALYNHDRPNVLNDFPQLQQELLDAGGTLLPQVETAPEKVDAIAALCLETLLDIQALLQLGFDTNIRDVIQGDTAPIQGLNETLEGLVNTRASRIGATAHQVIDDVSPTILNENA